MSIRWLHVARDVAFLFILTGLGGFVLGVLGIAGPNHMALIALSNLFFSTVGFTISGVLTPNHRWPHLAVVAVLTWLLSAVNMLFSYITFVMWVAAAFSVALTMASGGAISYLFRRPQETPPPIPVAPPLIAPPPISPVAVPLVPDAQPTEPVNPAG